MSLHLLNGLMNSGKTLIMTYYGYKAHKQGYKVYSNYGVNFPHVLINRDFIFYLGQEQPNLGNSCFLLDELWIWLDCRDAVANKVATYFFLQSSKDDSKIYITSQAFSQNDKRIKENYHRLSICNRQILDEGKFYNINEEKRFLPEELNRKLYIRNVEYKKSSSLYFALKKDFVMRLKADKIFPLFETRQKIKK